MDKVSHIQFIQWTLTNYLKSKAKEPSASKAHPALTGAPLRSFSLPSLHLFYSCFSPPRLFSSPSLCFSFLSLFLSRSLHVSSHGYYQLGEWLAMQLISCPDRLVWPCINQTGTQSEKLFGKMFECHKFFFAKVIQSYLFQNPRNEFLKRKFFLVAAYEKHVKGQKCHVL